jgi:hypothetical protein
MSKRGPTAGPGSDLWRWCLQGNRPHRADVHAGLTVLAGAFDLLTDSVEADHRLKASLGEIHFRSTLFCPANPNAPSAQHAPVWVITNEGMIFHNGGVFEILLKALWFQTHAKESGYVLKGAFLVSVTVSAIHIMHGEEKAKGAPLQVSYGRGVGFDNQWRGNPNRAGRNRFSVDFHETESAGGIRMIHALEETEVGNINAVAEAGLKEDCAFFSLQLFVVNHQFDHSLQSGPSKYNLWAPL